MKTCRRCNISQIETNFYARLDKENRCKNCVSEMRKTFYQETKQERVLEKRQYRKDHPEKIRDTKLRQAYGVGVAYFDKKLKEQNGVCAGCDKNVVTIWRGKPVNMALDHDHDTLRPRGVLCIKCNRALGLLEENPDNCFRLVDYIKKYKKTG